MEASTRIPTLSLEPDAKTIKRRLLQKGVFPTPKIVHTLRKKEIQKSRRKSKRIAEKSQESKPLSESQKQLLAEESEFRGITEEYRAVRKELKGGIEGKNGELMVGKPWEGLESARLRELASGSKEYCGEKLKGEHLVELSEILLERNREDHQWLVDDDIEEGDWMEGESGRRFPPKRRVGDSSSIQFLVKRLSDGELSMRDWKFSRLMNQSGVQFTERNLMKIVGGLGALGNWRQAMSVVEWVYSRNEFKHRKSRFVYTKLLAVLGKARRSREALLLFNLMREDCHIYPDMAAYHSVSVTLGQAGLVRELMNIIECMRRKPSKRIKNMSRRNWDPCLEPDLVVYNAVLNACVPSHQWKGVSWVFQQMRKSGLKPNGATFGLAMEVMLQSGQYDLVHMFFGKMRRSGAAPTALTYKVLVRAFWEEGKVNDAVEAVRDMERRGVVGSASVYYELACCLCKDGRWKEAMLEVEKLKKVPLTKSLEVTFTGMIMSCMESGHVDDCISIFEHMNKHCSPNIGTINAMLKVYGHNDMFAKAKDLFEETKRMDSAHHTALMPDIYTYSSMLEASAVAHQWEYFEYLYKEMALCGYQLDQNKQAWVLVEASRSGKGHLLEHAFDLTLEAGEIPHPSFFIEMVCQSAAVCNYERAIALVNTMACASFQVSEEQWTEAFTRSPDQINENTLSKLLDTIYNSDVVMEASAASLLKSLQFICGSNCPEPFSGLIALHSATKAKSLTDDDSSGMLSNKIQNFSLQVDGNPVIEDNPPAEDSVIVKSHTDNDSVNDCHTSLVSGKRDMRVNIYSSLEDSMVNNASNLPTDCAEDTNLRSILVENSQDADLEATLDSLIRQGDNPGGSDVPSASEILEAWKKSRHKDGIFFPFQTKCN